MPVQVKCLAKPDIPAELRERGPFACLKGGLKDIRCPTVVLKVFQWHIQYAGTHIVILEECPAPVHVIEVLPERVELPACIDGEREEVCTRLFLRTNVNMCA